METRADLQTSIYSVASPSLKIGRSRGGFVHKESHVTPLFLKNSRDDTSQQLHQPKRVRQREIETGHRQPASRFFAKDRHLASTTVRATALGWRLAKS